MRRTTPSPRRAPPTTHAFLAECPHALLATSGHAVGLPTGQMGNSEVGHMNIGAGRIVAQDLPRIDVAIEDGSLARRPVLLALIDKARSAQKRDSRHGSAVARRGAFAPGSHRSFGENSSAPPVCRSSSMPFSTAATRHPKAPMGPSRNSLPTLMDCAGVRLATVSGRFYAMDRDKRWDRVDHSAMAAMVDGSGRRFRRCRRRNRRILCRRHVTDEFLLPCVLGDYAGMTDGDVLLFANFRADRAREISASTARSRFCRLHPRPKHRSLAPPPA